MPGILLNINYLSFPGLGIDTFAVNEVAFKLFGREVRWYGIILTIGIIATCAFIYFNAKKAGFLTDDILDYFIFCIVFGIAGARIYYVLFNLDNFIVKNGSFWQNVKESLIKMVGIWNGGIAIYGGIIAIFITAYIISRKKRLPFYKIIDIGGPAAMIGQAIGRWGNFVNAEAYGTETDIFCRMGIAYSTDGKMTYYHPTFLYESLWNIIGFTLIMIFFRRRKYDGQSFLWYITWYGFGRMFIEALRTDSLYIGNTTLRISQVIGFACVIIGLILLLRNRQIYKDKPYLCDGGGNPEYAKMLADRREAYERALSLAEEKRNRKKEKKDKNTDFQNTENIENKETENADNKENTDKTNNNDISKE